MAHSARIRRTPDKPGAYVSKWYPKEQLGTALGIFGAGNVGAAVTKFIAPFIMVAYGWKTVANLWALALAVMAIIFWLTTNDDPQLQARRRAGARPQTLRAMLKPLKSVQVWRFSLYYFFVFGAFMALALWLPRYLIGVYGLDIATAGMIGALYSVPASLFRIYGGVLSDKYGARRIMYWTFGVSVAACFVLSYPPTEYIVQGIRGPITFRLQTGLVAFSVIAFVLGFFMSLGKAAVYKHIPVYYPNHVGSVGGIRRSNQHGLPSHTVLAHAHRRVVSVNGIVISQDAISREVQNHPSPTPIAAWTAAARALVVRELLLQEARSCGIKAASLTDESGRRETGEETLIRGLIETCVTTPIAGRGRLPSLLRA